MSTMDWDKLRIFYAVANAGSFTRAGEALSLSQSAISRQISALEESLKIPLFHRHARGLIPTEQGEILYKTVQDVFSKLASAENAILESKDRPKGPLKITTTVAFGTTWLTPRIREFAELYPEIAITLIVSDGELDLAMREADIAIRFYAPTQPDLIQRPLLTVHSGVYASSEYLQQYGLPKRPEDLDRHRLIAYGEDTRKPFAEVNWLLDSTGGDKGGQRQIIKINSLYGMLQAVKSGLGIASLPDYMTYGEKNLTRILEELKGPENTAYFVYPAELKNSKRVKVFRDFLVRKVAETKF